LIKILLSTNILDSYLKSLNYGESSLGTTLELEKEQNIAIDVAFTSGSANFAKISVEDSSSQVRVIDQTFSPKKINSWEVQRVRKMLSAGKYTITLTTTASFYIREIRISSNEGLKSHLDLFLLFNLEFQIHWIFSEKRKWSGAILFRLGPSLNIRPRFPQTQVFFLIFKNINITFLNS